MGTLPKEEEEETYNVIHVNHSNLKPVPIEERASKHHVRDCLTVHWECGRERQPTPAMSLRT